MKLHIEHKGRVVLAVEIEHLTAEERVLVERIRVYHPLVKAGSAECNADFVAYWSVGSVEGLCNGMRKKKK